VGDGKVIRGKNSQSCGTMLLVSAKVTQDLEAQVTFSLSVMSDEVDGGWVMANVMGLVDAQKDQFFCSGQVSVSCDWCSMRYFPSHDDGCRYSPLTMFFSSSLQQIELDGVKKR
jgi:hypothetical protein